VSVKWTTEFVLDPVPKALGCVADTVNIVCPSNGPFSEDKGYVSLYSENGTIRWRDHVLHFPTLPLLDNYGDVTGSDGVKLVHYDQNGKLYPIIKCYGLKPMFSMQLVGNVYLLLVSELGGLVVRDTNAIPVAEIFLNATIQNTNGTFLPISQPVVNGQRFYLLTEFVPESEEFDPSVFNLQRLYAIDINDRPADIMTIAWYFNFEMENRGHFKAEIVNRLDKIESISNSIQSKQNLLWDYSTQTVYVSLPPPYLGEPEMTSTFWGLKDEGNFTRLTIRSSLNVNHFATFEPDSDRGDFSQDTSKINKLWASSIVGVFYEVDAEGNVTRTIDLQTILGETVTVTSKVSLVRENDTATDILLFGATIGSERGNRKESLTERAQDASSFVMALDTSVQSGKILWMVPVPAGFEVKGQIAGFNGALSTDKAQIIFYAEKSSVSAKFISIN
jgi:hypothetical protein